MGGVFRLREEKAAGMASDPAEAGNPYSELVPSMYSLSDLSVENNRADAVATEPLLVPTPRSPTLFRLAAANWRLGSALIAAALLVSGTIFFASRHKGGSLSAAASNEAIIEKSPSIPAQTTSAQNEMVDESPAVKLKPTATSSAESPASRRTRSGRWEVRQFGDDVTVRRLKESTPIRSSANPKVRVVEN
jgi:hypothetical protein